VGRQRGCAEGARQVTDRERVQHQVVAAHGATDIGYTPDQRTRKHEQGAFKSKGESAKRTSGNSSVALGKHVSSEKNGIDVAKQRKDVVKSVRAKREKETFAK
jgi:hypothetical protein